MANDEEIFAIGIFAQKFLEVFETSFRGQRGGVEDRGFVSRLCAYQGCGLKTAFERARDDEVELYVQRIQYMR